MTQRFDTPNPILVDVRLPAGDVELDAGETNETEVTVEPRNDSARDRLDQVVVALEGDRLRIEVPENRFSIGRSPEYDVTVRCPTGSRVRLKTASADFTARGTVGGVEVKAASGDVTLADVEGDLRVDGASSDIRAASVSGDASVRSVSGDIELGRALGPVNAQSVSGDVRLREAHGRTQVQTVSGDLKVDRLVAGSLQLSAVSGDVDLAIVPGAAVWLDVRSLSGDMSSELAGGEEPREGEAVIEIRGKTVSGDVRVSRAVA
jgi:DUF4097 and DUF4098 domain-containing protein YvlB